MIRERESDGIAVRALMPQRAQSVTATHPTYHVFCFFLARDSNQPKPSCHGTGICGFEKCHLAQGRRDAQGLSRGGA
jgi:hypothetical protein